jgi:hypothetical protein
MLVSAVEKRPASTGRPFHFPAKGEPNHARIHE